MYIQLRVREGTPQHASASLGTGKEIRREPTLSYGHGNATVQMVF